MAFDQEYRGSSDTSLDSADHYNSSSPSNQAVYKQRNAMKIAGTISNISWPTGKSIQEAGLGGGGGGGENGEEGRGGG